MCGFDAEANITINNNHNTITTRDVIVTAGPGSSGFGINC